LRARRRRPARRRSSGAARSRRSPVTTLGTVEIKKKFTLKDLVFNSELEL